MEINRITQRVVRRIKAETRERVDQAVNEMVKIKEKGENRGVTGAGPIFTRGYHLIAEHQ